MGESATRVADRPATERIDLLGLRERSIEPLTGVTDGRFDRVEVAAQREQRRAQVMGDGADKQASLRLEVSLLLGCLREPGAHGCDRSGDVRDFPYWRGRGGLDRVAAGDQVDLRVQAA